MGFSRLLYPIIEMSYEYNAFYFVAPTFYSLLLIRCPILVPNIVSSDFFSRPVSCFHGICFHSWIWGLRKRKMPYGANLSSSGFFSFSWRQIYSSHIFVQMSIWLSATCPTKLGGGPMI